MQRHVPPPELPVIITGFAEKQRRENECDGQQFQLRHHALSGTLIAGDKIPARPDTRIAWRNGIPIAARIASQFTPLSELDPATSRLAQQAVQSQNRPVLHHASHLAIR